jgi:hypothetical protein
MKDIITGNANKKCYLNLGNLPLVNNLNDSLEESLESEKFPLSISLFEDSNLTRLDYIVETDKLFNNYVYLSGINKPYYTHCFNMFNYLNKYLNITSEDTIVDIGGNDGTLLKAFLESSKINLKVLNIEPSSVSEISKTNNIPTLKEYFTEETSKKIPKCKLITTTNVFQHLYDIVSFTRGVFNTLSDDGIWCLEFPYWKNTIETLQFDQIYHEHIYYYNFTPLYNFFKKEKLRVINVSKHSIHTGTLRLLITKENSKYITDNTIEDILSEEKDINIDYYLDLVKKIETHVKICKQTIQEISKDNNIVGFGAAAKGCVFLNYLGIKNDTIKYIIDDTKLKQNKYVPGTGIKIVDREIINKENIDYIVILAHNFYEYIIESLRNYGYKGKFIIFLPEIKII